jgi:hypothetical protein
VIYGVFTVNFLYATFNAIHKKTKIFDIAKGRVYSGVRGFGGWDF